MMKKLYIMISVFVSLVSCDDFYPISIVNESQLIIGIYLAFDPLTAYPDTALNFKKDNVNFSIKPGSTANDGVFYKPLNDYFKDLPGDTLSIYIFDRVLLDEGIWENIKNEYNILQRYDLSYEDLLSLENKNGVPVVTYPPTENMKNMKMFPPYQ